MYSIKILNSIDSFQTYYQFQLIYLNLKILFYQCSNFSWFVTSLSIMLSMTFLIDIGFVF